MDIVKLPVVRNGQLYQFEPYLGLLLVRTCDGALSRADGLPSQVKRTLLMNDNPYRLQLANNYTIPDVNRRRWLKLYTRMLVRVCRASFGLARFIASFRLPVFNNATEAILFFRQMLPGQMQQNLCFPRSLFAAATSKNFRTGGVLFIGVFLPSRSMHAWVIEDAIQPDPYDNMWINFQPVAACYFSQRT